MDNQNQFTTTHTEQTPEPEKPITDKKDIALILLAFIAAFLVVDFGFGGGFRLGFSVAYVFLFAVTTFYLAKKDKIRPFPLTCGILSVCIAPVFALYCESGTLVIAFFAIAFLWAIYIGGLGGVLWHGIGGFRVLYDVVLICLEYPITFITAFFKALGRKSKLDGSKSTIGKIGYVLVGLLLAIPAMAILLPLMIRSDEAFAELMQRVFGQFGMVLGHAIVALILTPLLTSLLFAMRNGLPTRPAKGSSPRVIVSPIICGFFGVLSFFYIFYLCSQLSYFVSAFRSILPAEYTYADYARRGFFELCAITVINLFIMFCAFTLVKKSDDADDIPRSVKGFGIFISLFNLFLVGTAIAKMALYIGSYGLTQLRVLTTIFMLMMGILLICLVLRLMIRRFSYMAVTIIACTLLGTLTLYADVNTTVARYNTWAYLSGRHASVDISTLVDVGAAGVPSLEKLSVEAPDYLVRERAANSLREISHDYYLAPDFRAYNYTTQRASKILEKYPALPVTDGEQIPSATTSNKRIIYSFGNGYCISKCDNVASFCKGVSGDICIIEGIDKFINVTLNGNDTMFLKQKNTFYYVDLGEDYVSSGMSYYELTEFIRETGNDPYAYPIDLAVWSSV